MNFPASISSLFLFGQIVCLFCLWVQVESAVDNGSILDKELQNELMLTKDEKHALDKLKSALPRKLPLDYLKMDLVLIRWLRAKHLNVDQTLHDIKALLEFRHKNRMANFTQHDWSDLFPHSQHPFRLQGVDKAGRPIGYMSIGDGWDVRSIILQGKRDRLNLFIVNAVLELVEGRVLEMNRKQPNITQFVFLFNFNDFNLIQHGCPLCVSTYTYWLEVYERYIPGFAHDIVFVNAPSRYQVALQLFRPNLSEYTSRVLKVFGTNKREWKPYLDSKIDPSQLPWEFGGMAN